MRTMTEATWPPENVVLHRWIREGIECVVLAGPMAFCGYAKVPLDHQFHNLGYDQAYDQGEIYVHGGLTFSRTTSDGTWFGFDCAHAGDARGQPLDVRTLRSSWPMSMVSILGRLSVNPTIRERAWSVMDVVEETCFLAHQLAIAKGKKCRKDTT